MLYFPDYLRRVKWPFGSLFEIIRFQENALFSSLTSWSPPPLTYMCFSFDSSCESSPDTPLPVHQCLNSGHPEKNQLSSCLGWESAEDERDDGWLGSVHWCAISPSRRWRSMGLPFSSFSFTEIELLLFVHWLCCVNLARAETSFQFY